MKKIIFALSMLMSVASMQAQSNMDLDFSFLDPDAGKGWEMNVEAGYNVTFQKKAGWDSQEHCADIFAGFGYNFSKNWYVGVESGTILSVGSYPSDEGNTTANLIPILADVRYSITTSSKWVPFVEIRGGYGLRTKGKGNYNNYTIFDPRLGVKYRASRSLDFRLAVGYMGLWSSNCPGESSFKNLDEFTIQAGVGLHF